MKNFLLLILSLFVAGQSFSQTLLAQAKPAGSKVWGYIAPDGKFVIEANYPKCYAFSEDGFAPIYSKKRKSFYFIDAKGSELKTDVKQFKLRSVFGFGPQGFEDGLALIQVGKLWGYMDATGKLAITTQYEKATKFTGGNAAAKKGDNWVILSKSGTETEVDAKGALEVRNFSEGLAPIKTANKMMGFVDPAGKLVIEAKFKAVGYFVDGLAYAKKMDGKVGFINQKGEWVIEAQFSKAKDFIKGSEFARVTKGEVKGFVSKDGKFQTITDAESFGDFHDGLAYGKKGGMAGFFDAKGMWVIKPTFQAVKNFKNGYARAKQNDKWGFIDKVGNWVIEPQFDGVRDFVKLK